MNSIDKPDPHAAEEPPEYDPCQLIAKADAFAHATEDRFDEPQPTEDRAVPRRSERLAHLIGATAEVVATYPFGQECLATEPRSTFALDVAPDAVPQHVAPDASAASCTISIAIVPYRAAGGAS
jgi:hypothetical protein